MTRLPSKTLSNTGVKAMTTNGFCLSTRKTQIKKGLTVLKNLSFALNCKDVNQVKALLRNRLIKPWQHLRTTLPLNQLYFAVSPWTKQLIFWSPVSPHFPLIFPTSNLKPPRHSSTCFSIKIGLCVSNKSSRVMMPHPVDSWACWQLKLPVWISGTT